MTREEATQRFLALVAQYGLGWTASVPAEAYGEMDAISQVLSGDDKREALLNRGKN